MKSICTSRRCDNVEIGGGPARSFDHGSQRGLVHVFVLISHLVQTQESLRNQRFNHHLFRPLGLPL